MNKPSAFLDRLPKSELHIHIEGSLEPELMFALAQRNKVRLPYGSVGEIRRAYDFANLQDFLDLYYQGMSVLQTEQDFYDLAWAYFSRVAAQKVSYVELFFDPQGHTSRGVAFATVVDGIDRARADAAVNLGLNSRIIMCFLRHLDEADAERTLDTALDYKGRIAGVGLDSSEVGFPPSKFKSVFRRAREEGFRLVAHAGEEGPPQYVWEALDILGVDRIDHGNRAMEDDTLVQRLARDRMALTVCPLSNLRLKGVRDLQEHPLKRMLDKGLFVTVNSDDPAYFGGYIGENYSAIHEALHLADGDMRTIARNGFAASFMADEEKKKALATFDRVAV